MASRRSARWLASIGLMVRVALLAWCAVIPAEGVHAASGVGRHGAAATVHPLATEAAVEAMRNGGNAIDAAVAAALTLGVVDGHNSGIGGGCFLLIRLADGTALAIDGREKAPATATRDMFAPDGKADTRLSQTGALAPGVPGSLAAYDHALTHHGKLPLATHLNLAAQLAERGMVVTKTYAQRLDSTAEDLRKFEPAKSVFLNKDGEAWEAGDLLKQPDLAKSYRAIADQGIGWFYGGRFAEATAAWMKSNGGLLTTDDFKGYEIKLREPIQMTYRGHEIVGFPPPSSGGVA